MNTTGEPDRLASVRDGYDRWAAVYDHDGNPLPALEEPYVQEAIGDVCGLADARCSATAFRYIRCRSMMHPYIFKESTVV